MSLLKWSAESCPALECLVQSGECQKGVYRLHKHPSIFCPSCSRPTGLPRKQNVQPSFLLIGPSRWPLGYNLTYERSADLPARPGPGSSSRFCVHWFSPCVSWLSHIHWDRMSSYRLTYKWLPARPGPGSPIRLCGRWFSPCVSRLSLIHWDTPLAS